jgi:hypothetical protein
MNWIKKLIPAYIEIRSLYWVEHEKQMDRALGDIFYQIDEDNYEKAQILIDAFERKFSQGEVPHWVAIKYAEIYRASSMVNFLKS